MADSIFKSFFRRKEISGLTSAGSGLKQSLSLKDLTLMGIAAVVGAGIFSTIGNAVFHGGPAVVFLFVFTSLACALSALCYAQFASVVAANGSAYTYAYVSMGELVAWIIGWDLIMEYAIGNIAVAISWSDYFTSLLDGLNIHIPDYCTMDFLSAQRGNAEFLKLKSAGLPVSEHLSLAHRAWTSAPEFFGVKLVGDIPALLIVVLITVLVYVGIEESKKASNAFVYLKLVILLVVLLVGAFYVKPENWSPFLPHGVGGVLKSVSAVFFAYIGFDALSTTAEECRDSKRDLPRAMLLSLFICAVIYVLITLVITGMVSYAELNVGDPMAYVFQKLGLNFFAGFISLSAVIAMAGVLLVFQLGQPRIWYSMSRDGLLPQRFSKIHPRFKTPSFATVITGLLVALPALFMNLTEVTDLTSIGTLFAFIVVCVGVIIMDQTGQSANARFKVPYVNGKWIVPVFLLVYISWVVSEYELEALNFESHFSLIVFFVFFVMIAAWTFVKNISLIPVTGLLANIFMMAELGITNWIRFLIWLAIGLVIYFCFGRKNSKLNTHARQ